MKRTGILTLLASLALLNLPGLPTTATAAPKSHPTFRHGHYVGEPTCTAGDDTDCAGFVIFRASRHRLRGFEASVRCYARPTNGEDEFTATIGVSGRSVRITQHRHFDTGTIKTVGGSETTTFRARGTLHGRRAVGRIDVAGVSSSSTTGYTCSSRKVPLHARFRARPLYQTGHYQGTTSCFDAPDFCAEQNETITFHVTRGAVLNLSTAFVCQNFNNDTTETRTLHLSQLPLDWAGRFRLETTVPGVATPATVSVSGRVIGHHTTGIPPDDTDAGFNYDETDLPSGSSPQDDCHADSIVFQAHRIG